MFDIEIFRKILKRISVVKTTKKKYQKICPTLHYLREWRSTLDREIRSRVEKYIYSNIRL